MTHNACTAESAQMGEQMDEQVAKQMSEQATMKKVMRRLIPFILLCYVVSYLDRINVGFAALTMNKDLVRAAKPTLMRSR